ncbi:Retinoblastoma-related protein [Camellia lanceoleosa]|uniref:Retinoblastoma-related protein n=1 Tax=Camellia lanceoleosa TaxID=1840588 RepID=A0ACC0FIH5_9ERIC|nr:Retinoblastoma-related protein [Camellia lanceoleosa]
MHKFFVKFVFPSIDGLIYFKDLLEDTSLSSSLNILENDYADATRNKSELDERVFVNKEDSLLGSGSSSGGAMNISGAKVTQHQIWTSALAEVLTGLKSEIEFLSYRCPTLGTRMGLQIVSSAIQIDCMFEVYEALKWEQDGSRIDLFWEFQRGAKITELVLGDLSSPLICLKSIVLYSGRVGCSAFRFGIVCISL